MTAPFRLVWRIRAELSLSIALLAGWFLLTWGIVLLTTPKVWPLSAGVLLLSLCGWRLLWTVCSQGLYSLTREEQRGP